MSEQLALISKILGFTYLGAGLFFFLLVIPMVLGKVAMNRWYGIRIPQSTKSPEAWDAINRFGGKCFMGWAGLLMIGGAVVLVFPFSRPDYVVPFMLVMTVLISVPLGLIWFYAKKFD